MENMFTLKPASRMFCSHNVSSSSNAYCYHCFRVFISNDIVREEIEKGTENIDHLFWVAVVQEIKEDKNGRLVRIVWYYSFDDARKHLQRPL